MCLGIPGRIIGLTDAASMMAMAEVSGVRRAVNAACVAGADPGELVGKWAPIHVGFAMSLTDEDEDARTLQALRDLGEAQKAPELMKAGELALCPSRSRRCLMTRTWRWTASSARGMCRWGSGASP